MALAVALGAFGAHALASHLDAPRLAWWDTASRYHMIHGLALFAVDYVASLRARVGLAPRRSQQLAGWLFVVGLVLFCGSLYVMALTGIRVLGAITPLGGTAWIAAWILLAVAAWRPPEA